MTRALRFARGIGGRYRRRRAGWTPLALVLQRQARPFMRSPARDARRVDVGVHVALAIRSVAPLVASVRGAWADTPMLPATPVPHRPDGAIGRAATSIDTVVRRCVERRVRVEPDHAAMFRSSPASLALPSRRRSADAVDPPTSPRLVPPVGAVVRRSPAAVVTTQTAPATPGTRDGGAPARAAHASSPVNVEQITARVIETIDRRIVARRERLGSF